VPPNGPHKPFSGRARRRTTGLSVRVADVTSRLFITIGGVGTIVAVAAVFVFLVAVVVPLFLPARTSVRPASEIAWAPGEPLHLAVDEYRTIGWLIDAGGELVAWQLETGAVLQRTALVEPGARLTALSVAAGSDLALVGQDNGSIQAWRLGFDTHFLFDDEVPESFYHLQPGEGAAHRGGVVERTAEGQFRLQVPAVERVGRPRRLGDQPVAALHHTGGSAISVCALTGAGPAARLHAASATLGDSPTGDGMTIRWGQPIALPHAARSTDPAWVRIAAGGADVFVAWRDGTVRRVRSSNPEAITVAEERTVVAPGRQLTTLEFLLGGATLLAGDSAGDLGAWFLAPDGSAADGFRLVRAHDLAAPARECGAVRRLSMGTRRRLCASLYDDGSIGLFYVPGAARLLHVETSPHTTALALGPKENELVALAPQRLLRFDLDPRHPEASPATLFTPVWYEGYAQPQFMWQSSSGTDDSEPKLSLVPLIFGTLKATFYSMLFGAPLALLAAIYTSEFLDRRWRSRVKPSIEMMASLPSVVLGFVAALVVAPSIQQVLPLALAAIVTIPSTVLAGAVAWQLLPARVSVRGGRRRLLFIGACLPLGLLLAAWLGPAFETALFGGDLKAWLHGARVEPPVGRALGGWLLLLLPVSAVIATAVNVRWVNPLVRARATALPRPLLALLPLLKLLCGGALALTLALAAGLALESLGLDLRKPLPLLGSFLDTYDQRNALVVGFIMGFAIIPIIYTIAEDALTAVPEHLRGASLGAGATPWQTAMRVIVPTAMSGLFSALMIGLGRAVGETMIVLMAAGNTPVMSMNIFEGFRTLSANIAVELPEAPVGETHYRTLFLAALVLFAMTFAVNTVAEWVRLRFRRRAWQL
jgi:phosphate transport system permease protein